MNGNDRYIHARTRAGWFIVRYDRAGKWYAEHPDRAQRRQLTLEKAVAEATQEGSYVYLGVPGGRRFDAKVRDEVLSRHGETSGQ